MLDPLELERYRRWRRVYLARYMRISPSECDETPIDELNGYVRQLSELLKSESSSSPMGVSAETDYT